MSCQSCQDETRDCYACSLRERISTANERAGKAEAEVKRLRGVVEDFAERDCEYGDGCPVFGSRHGRCVGCVARAALATTSATPTAAKPGT